MLNNDFDPYNFLQHLALQDTNHAENMVKMSEFMLALSQQTDSQTRQMDALFTMIQNQNKLVRYLDDRVKALESTTNNDINNKESKEEPSNGIR